MKLTPAIGITARRGDAAHTLVEVLVALGILAVATVGTIEGYVFAAQQAEWSAYSLAAHALAQQTVEQTRAAKWDTEAFPAIDEVLSTNFPTVVSTLDLPNSGTNVVLATNFVAITSVSANPPFKMIQVDCVWAFASRGVFTNTVLAYRAPDQ